MKTKIELIKVEEIINSIQNENELFNKIMPLIKSIDQNAFRNSQFRGEFNCPYLQAVGNSAFLNSEFNGLFNCQNLQEVGQFAFSLSYFRGEFNCPNLTTVGKFAFRYSVFRGEFNCPNLQTVGNNAFANSKFTGEFNCPNVQEVGNEAFYFSQFTGEFNCPNVHTIGQYAFANSIFNTITIGANATLGIRCIGAHSDEFIKDYEANGKQAGTYVWNGEHWIYQNKNKKYKVMETQGNEHIYADVRKSMNTEEFEKSIESVLNDYNVSKEEKVVELFKLGLYPTDILEYVRVGLAEVYYILDLAKKEGKFNDKLK